MLQLGRRELTIEVGRGHFYMTQHGVNSLLQREVNLKFIIWLVATSVPQLEPVSLC